MIVVCTFWWRKCIACLWQRGSQLPECVHSAARRQWSKNQMTNYNCTHTKISGLVASEGTVMTAQMVVKQSKNMFQQPAVLDSKLLPFALFPCFADFPRLLNVSSVWVTDSMASRSSWKRQCTWSRKLQDVLEIFSVCRTDSRKVRTELVTPVMRYRSVLSTLRRSLEIVEFGVLRHHRY
jgi:hypothetical protein